MQNSSSPLTSSPWWVNLCDWLSHRRSFFWGNIILGVVLNIFAAYLTLSTGTGAALHLRKAATILNVSIEIGHQLLDGNLLVCLCGQVGCLETFTGGKQLELRLGHSVAQVSDRAFWETFTDKLALGLVNLAQLTRVETIAVSGAIMLHNKFLLPLLQQKVNSIIRGTLLELRPALLGENAPLIGAAILLVVSH